MIDRLPLLAWPPGNILTVLIFHRVLPVADPLRPDEPDAKCFDRIMRFVARNFEVLPLVEAADMLISGKLPRRACCVTFDDGYADNLTVALPILESYLLPATVFVATGYLDGGRMFNDMVIDAIAKSEYGQLDLRDIKLNSQPIATIEEKRKAVGNILGTIKFRPPEIRDKQITELLEIANCGTLPDDLMLTSEQVRELSRRGIEIGAHTVAHTILTTLDDDRAREEIGTSKRWLEALTGKPITSFAYPNGKPGRDYHPKHVSIVREMGFKVAVTTAPGVGRRNSDHLQLPRFSPWGTSNFTMGAQILRNAWTGLKAT